MKPGPKRDQSNADILAVFADAGDPALFAREVAEAFDKSTEWARQRLSELETDGLVASKQPGDTAMWWITIKGRQSLEGQSSNSGSQ